MLPLLFLLPLNIPNTYIKDKVAQLFSQFPEVTLPKASLTSHPSCRILSSCLSRYKLSCSIIGIGGWTVIRQWSSFTWKAALLSITRPEGNKIEQKYLAPIVAAPQIEILPLFPENAAQEKILKLIREAFCEYAHCTPSEYRERWQDRDI